jgi:hypothetical protein
LCPEYILSPILPLNCLTTLRLMTLLQKGIFTAECAEDAEFL